MTDKKSLFKELMEHFDERELRVIRYESKPHRCEGKFYLCCEAVMCESCYVAHLDAAHTLTGKETSSKFSQSTNLIQPEFKREYLTLCGKVFFSSRSVYKHAAKCPWCVVRKGVEPKNWVAPKFTKVPRQLRSNKAKVQEKPSQLPTKNLGELVDTMSLEQIEEILRKRGRL